jgi:hypothetical protein
MILIRLSGKPACAGSVMIATAVKHISNSDTSADVFVAINVRITLAPVCRN